MVSMYWPIALIVLSNLFYNICSKSTPAQLNPLASLTVTYLVGAAVSAAAFFLLNPGARLGEQLRQVNWTTFVLGIAIVGLEAGSIYMYKAGWPISTGQLVHSSLLAIVLIAVGAAVYHEAITVTKVVGAAVCLVGLYLMNR